MIYARKCFPNVAIKGQLRSAPKFPRKIALTAKETEEYNLYVTETTTACEKCLEEKGKERRAAERKRNLFVMKQNGYAFCKKIFEIEEY